MIEYITDQLFKNNWIKVGGCHILCEEVIGN